MPFHYKENDMNTNKKHRYRIFYSQGLGGPIDIEADNVKEAKQSALAEFRRHCTFVDPRPVDEVILSEVVTLA